MVQAPLEDTTASKWLRKLLRDHMRHLQGELLKRLISGKASDVYALNDELELYGIPIEPGDLCAVLLIRPDEGFRDYISLQDAALEFALGNIAEENLQRNFVFLRCKDSYGHLVFLVKARRRIAADPQEYGEMTLQYVSERIQNHVRAFLKGKAAVAASPQGYVSCQIPYMYRSALHLLRTSRNGMPANMGSKQENKQTRPSIVGRVQTYIRSHLSEDVSLQGLSEQVYLHPAYLSKLYKERTGEGLSDYILRVKMEYAAKLLLLERDKKIYEIGLEVGYQNQSYFSQVFKKWYGMTPLEYRKT
jgi:AraC-like DNA-binding protein